MEKDFNKKRAEIEKEIKKLPEQAQMALCWLVENFDFVEKMADKSDMTDEEIKKQKESATQREDYIALALLCVAQAHRKKDPETMD